MIAESLEPTVRVSSASSLFVFFVLAFALMWICFFTVAFVLGNWLPETGVNNEL